MKIGPARSSAQAGLWDSPHAFPVKKGQQSVHSLYRATPGSTGLDLSSTTYTVLTPDMGPQSLSTGVYGPLPEGTLGLILGRSSSTMEGLQVFPGVIDNDYTGEIKIMAKALHNIVTIPAEKRIAQHHDHTAYG